MDTKSYLDLKQKIDDLPYNNHEKAGMILTGLSVVVLVIYTIIVCGNYLVN